MFGAPIVVANAAHADQVTNQLAQVGCAPQVVVLEPVARNTAPAIALAALAAGSGDTPLLVMPSDHVIADVRLCLWQWVGVIWVIGMRSMHLASKTGTVMLSTAKSSG